MRILITGAGRAIGRATATCLAEAGHEVVATARDVHLLDDLDVAAKLSLDVTSASSIEACLAAAGDLDAMVNNAALSGKAPLEQIPLDHLRAMFETNTFGPLALIQAVLPAWRTRGSGVIVNVSSIQGRVATPLEGAYAATKFALEAFTESLHYEVGHFGIRLVLIEPGFTAPGMRHLQTSPSTLPTLASSSSGMALMTSSLDRVGDPRPMVLPERSSLHSRIQRHRFGCRLATMPP